MTTDSSDFDRRARDWLEDGPVQLADPVLDATLAAVPHTPQQRRTPVRRLPMQLTMPRLIAAVVAILVVTGGAIGLAVFRTSNAVISQPPPAVPHASAAVVAPSASVAPGGATFVDPNTYLVAMHPGYVAPGSDGPAGWLQLVAPGQPSGVKVEVGVDGDLDMPAWSPDGTRIAFVARTSGSTGLWTAAADGSGAAKVADCKGSCASIDYPAWSPDGTRILFTQTDIPPDAARPTAARLVVMTLEGGKRTVVVEGGPDALPDRASWSPDGARLVFDRFEIDAGGHPTGSALSIIGTDGSGETPIHGLAANAAEPSWSEADVIAFDDGLNVYTVPAGGGTPTRVTNLSTTSQQANVQPGWTSDGRIVYVHQPTNGTNVVMSVAADGTDPAVVFSGGGRVYPGSPAARP